MKNSFLGLFGVLCLVASALADKVVINEIMYHPFSENPREEYIELFNAGSNTVNLAGWKFTSGIQYTFTNSFLAPWAYLVIAADRAVFAQKYSEVTNVAGNWIGQLSNGGEKIELHDALGQEMDTVTYFSSGDWGRRLLGAGEKRVLSITRSGSNATVTVLGNYAVNDTVMISGADQPEYNGKFTIKTASASLPNNATSFTITVPGSPDSPATGRIIYRQFSDAGHTGWSWTSRAAGLGASLELMNPNLPNPHGQNWQASLLFNGTPGRANSVAASNLAPLILEARHYPLIPTPSNSVTIVARLLDEHASGLTATLHWRVDAKNPPPFTPVPMFDDGLHNDGLAADGLYGAVLSAQTNATVVEYYVEARDLEGNARTWPAPALDENEAPIQQANALFQVDDTVYTGPQPVYRLIMRAAERDELLTFPSAAPWSNAGMNTTFISVDGGGSELRYLCEVRDRGAGTRHIDPANFKVSLPADHPWKGLDAFNLNTQYTHAQMMGYALAAQAGLDTEAGRFAQVRINGVNRARAGSPQYGSYIFLESTDGHYAARHWPNDPDGNVYRCQSWGHDATLEYLGTNFLSYANVGYTKQNNTSENDWSDLIHLTDVLNNRSDPDYAQAVRPVANVDQWMRFMALFQLTGSLETSLATGTGDDYSIYRGVKDSRFLLLCHDWDTILGEGDTAGQININIFRMTSLPAPWINRFMKHPDFVPLYFKHLKELADTVFSPAQMERTLKETISGVAPQSVMDRMMVYNSGRVANVLSQIPLSLTVSSALGTNNGYLHSSNATVSLDGLANAIRTRSVKVNGQAATWSAWEAKWSVTGVELRPGINRVLLQACDAEGQEFERSSVDIWYDDSSVASVSGTLAASAIWTSGAGPYAVTGTLTVPSGVDLTIQPGTTVYFAGGAGITVTGTGRLLAEGADTQRIRFTRPPGATGNWSYIYFNNASNESRLSYVDFEYAGSGGHNIEANNSVIYLDHLAFANTSAQYVTLDNSSFVIRHCVFPSLSGVELIHGLGLPATGHGIFEGNVFGTTTGLNDIIDFTGGQRPGAILQFLNNIFTAGSDDNIDLDGTDAHIEGNIFMHTHQSASLVDSSSAISGGSDSGKTSHLVIVRNFFFDEDHIALAKEGNFYSIVNNTAVQMTESGVLFDESGRHAEGVTPGKGAYLDGNILWDTPQNFEEAYVNDPLYGTVEVTVNRSILSGTDLTTNGANNIQLNPQFVNENLASITYATMTNDLRLLSGSPAIGAGPNGLDMGASVPAGVSISGVPRSPAYLTEATLIVGGPGYKNPGIPVLTNFYRFRLNDGLWSGDIEIDIPIHLAGLTNGTYSVAVIGRNDAGVWQSVEQATTKTWVVDTHYSRLVINEILARNDDAVAVNGLYPDLAELYNDGGAPMDLSGMSLSNETNNPAKFVFPPGTTLPAGGYLVLQADNNLNAPGFHLGFKLNKTGDSLYLFDKGANGGAMLDSVTFGIQLPNLSIGRLADRTWSLTKPTLGFANLAVPLANAGALKINEWLADARTLFQDDFIEIYNPSSAPIAMGGLYLADLPTSPAGYPDIPPLSFIAARDFAVFIADGQTAQGANHLAFKLAPEQGAIGLFAADQTRIDIVLYGPQTADVSQGRSPSGALTLAYFTQPTPGAGNPGTQSNTNIITQAISLIPAANVWRYEQTGIPAADWITPGYTGDTAWSAGAALLYVESNAQPWPKNTPLTLDRMTYYFRTHFNVSTNLAGAALNLNAIIDDGAVFYLNGKEVLRLHIDPTAVINYNTAADDHESALEGPYPLQISDLREGDNVMAVEVHQVRTSSTDIVFGMSLDAVYSITNTSTNTTQLNVVLNEIMARNLSQAIPQGVVNDWIELHNPSASSGDVAGLSLTDDPNAPRKWIFPANSIMASGSFLVVNCIGNQPSSPTNTGFNLSAHGGAVYLFDAPANGGALLDSVAYGLQAPGLSIGRASPASPWMLTYPTPGAVNSPAVLGNALNLKINEWMANPASGEDWFELYNPDASPVALGGLYLTDDLNRRTQHQVAALSFMGGGENGFARFDADNAPGRGADHITFKLSSAGESIGLFSADGSLIDAVSFGVQNVGVSEGRFPDGSASRLSFPESASPGAGNYLPLKSVVVNEVLNRAQTPMENAIELFNPSSASADLSGWFISDNGLFLKKFRIPDNTVILPGGFKVFYEYQFNASSNAIQRFQFKPGQPAEVWLSTADGTGALTGRRAVAKMGGAAKGVSFGRFVTSVGEEFTALDRTSFGADQATNLDDFRRGPGAPNAYPKVGPIVISEIMYHPVSGVAYAENPDEEYVELMNMSAQPVAFVDSSHPTNTWRLRDAIDFAFPANTILPAGGLLVVVAFDPAANLPAVDAFRKKYQVPAGALISGPYQGRLDNAGESVELVRPDPDLDQIDPFLGVPYLLADHVHYYAQAPWPSAADGSGMSLHRLKAGEYGNDPLNWTALPANPGQADAPPVIEPPTIVTPPASITVFESQDAAFNVSVKGAPPFSYQWLFNEAPIDRATNSNFLISMATRAHAGDYRVKISNSAGYAFSSMARLEILPRPQIIGVSARKDGAFQFQISGINGHRLVVESSVNLIDWLPLATNPAPAQVWDFADTNAPLNMRFYRTKVF